MLWIETNRLLRLLDRCCQIVLRGVVIRPGLVRVGAVGLLVSKQIEVSLGLLQRIRRGGTVWITNGHQQVRQVNMGAIIVRIELHRSVQLLEGALHVPELQICLTELEMRLCISAVDLGGVRILDCSLAVLALCEIFFSAVEVLLLADIRVARTPGQQDEQKRTEKQQTRGTGTAHCISPVKATWK